MGLRSLLGLGENKKLVRSYFGRQANIIDLRPKADFDYATVPNAINIELEGIEKNIEKIKAMEPVVLCCNTGFKSDEVAHSLRKEGVDAINGGSWNRIVKIISAQ